MLPVNLINAHLLLKLILQLQELLMSPIILISVIWVYRIGSMATSALQITISDYLILSQLIMLPYAHKVLHSFLQILLIVVNVPIRPQFLMQI